LLSDKFEERFTLPTESVQYRLNMGDIVIELVENRGDISE